MQLRWHHVVSHLLMAATLPKQNPRLTAGVFVAVQRDGAV
jgi:hypothetical protein